MSRGAYVSLSALLVVGLLAPGCASLRARLPAAADLLLPKPAAPEAPPEPDLLVRPDAPPEYDLLVAQQLIHDGKIDDALEAYQRAVAKDEDSAFLHRKVAAALAQHDRLDESLHHAQRAVELEPEDVPSRIFLGQIHRMRREPDEAEAVLIDAEGLPFDADSGHLLYQIYVDADRLPEALDVALWLVDQDPTAMRAWIAVSEAYQRMQRPEDAEVALREALEEDPGNLRLYGRLARSLRVRGAHAEEAALYTEILEQYPHQHATLVALGEAQMALEDLRGAIGTFEAIIERYPDDLESVMRLGYLHFEAREFVAAGDLFERTLEAQPDRQQVAFFLGVVRRRTGDSAAALEAFQRIPAGHEHYADARTQMAAVYERRGDYALAIAEVERAIAAEPNRELDLYHATLRAKGGDFTGAVLHLEQLIAASPDDDELLFSTGVVYGEANQPEKAVEYMLQALEKNPDNAAALNFVGYTWAESGERLDEAQKMIERAIELRPNDGYIVDSLGWVYYMRAVPLMQGGDSPRGREYLDRALRELQHAADLSGGDPVISEHLGDAYLLLDDRQRALEMFEEAIRLEPREGEQPELLEKFESLRQELH